MKIHWTALATCIFVVVWNTNLDAATQASTEPDPTDLATIWDGVYTDDQASRGQRVYETECTECHLETLMVDGNAPALIGRTFFVRWSDLSVADMVVATRSTMPEFAPDSLSTEQYVDIAAYVLAQSEVPSGDNELPADLGALAEIIVTKEAE